MFSLGAPKGDLGTNKPDDFIGFSLGAPKGDTRPGTRKDFLRFLLGGPQGGLMKTLGLLEVFVGAPKGDLGKTSGFPWVFAGCSRRGPKENLRICLDFRWVLPRETSEKPECLLRFSLDAP